MFLSTIFYALLNEVCAIIFSTRPYHLIPCQPSFFVDRFTRFEERFSGFSAASFSSDFDAMMRRMLVFPTLYFSASFRLLMPASLSLITNNFCSRDNSLYLDEDASESFRLRAEVDGFGGILSITII